MSSFPEPLWIGPVSPEDRGEALRFVVAEPTEQEYPGLAESVRRGLETTEEARWFLWGAYRGRNLLGGQIAQIQPGRTALVWPPRFKTDQPPEVVLALVEGLCEKLAMRGVNLAYTFLERDRGADSRLMQVAGFSFLVQLLYLVSREQEFPSVCPSSELSFEPYGPENHHRLLRTIEATYVQTLDCPRLNEKRDIEDVARGYRATGVHRPELWQIVRVGQQDVGCLLLTDHPEEESLELIYMGLVPSARGKGWGIEIARYAQWLTRLAGRGQLLLGVDADNWPAIGVYAAVGFRQWTQKMVYARCLG